MIGDRFLTKKEFDLWVQNLNRRLSGLSIIEGGVEEPVYTPEHNKLESIQGGQADEYYHFKNAEHTELVIIAVLGRGIADDNLVVINSATIAALDYAKFTVNGLEGKSYAEVLADLSGQALAAFDLNDQDLDKISALIGKEIATPANPGAGYNKLYFKVDDKLYRLDSDGNESEVGDGAGANHNLLSATHLDALADNVIRGDLIIGNATPKWARLAKGNEGHVLKMGADDPLWAAESGGEGIILDGGSASVLNGEVRLGLDGGSA